MKILEMLPSLDTDALATVHANATRLNEKGTVKQRQQASEVLPAIEAERARRAEGGIVNVRETVKAVVKTRAASKPKPKAKPRVVVVQDREHDEDEL
jgi:hypothetical protein